MRQAILVGISALLLVIFLPVLLLEPIEDELPEAMVLVIEAEAQEQKHEEQQADMVLRLKTGQEILELPLETYLIGVVLSEMPASFELEALKAQAVAARTFTMRQMENSKHTDCDVCADSSCCQAWSSREAMEEKLGETFLQYWQKAQEAVKQTAGEVLTYEGNLIEAVYFSCSGGATEDAVAVWGSEVPYLQSVTSTGEEQASKYQSTTAVPLERFQQLLRGENPAVDLSGVPSGWFGTLTRTEGGGVEVMEIGGQQFSGTTLRSLFGLNSTKFSIEITEEEILFQVSGYGHRVGMSQYGANAMAKAGKTYDEILLHYYTGVTLETKNP